MSTKYKIEIPKEVMEDIRENAKDLSDSEAIRKIILLGLMSFRQKLFIRNESGEFVEIDIWGVEE